MSFWKKVFGQDAQAGTQAVKSHQLPSSMVADGLGEVNVAEFGDSTEVMFTILMEPTGSASEGWQTGVALDASGSMESQYGMGLLEGPNGRAPDSLMREYVDRGWITITTHNGRKYTTASRQAKIDLVERGHCRFTINEVEPLAQQMTAYLADNLDADGGTTVIYWACGNGSQIEEVGDLTAMQCTMATFRGPEKLDFGSGTVLTPAVRYFAERFSDAQNGMYIFITDGELHDLEEVKRYTVQLCKQIEAGQRNPLKCVLIGVGPSINEDQMEELDDLDSGTDVDIWDHKIATDMRQLVEIFAEVVSENQIVAPSGRIYDSAGKVVANFSDGVPAKVSFSMPTSSDYFELEVGEHRIQQRVRVAQGVPQG
jgi:hypothetical protein